ncbi:MAG: hypothetical protein KJP00_09190 [Bacteroidia bacterium]|nr:hypothetical protein [Bacteroidia bacterium]
MSEFITKYFRGEKRESYLFISAGFLFIILSYYGFFVSQEDLHNGAAIPFGLIGLIQVVVGANIAYRTDNQLIGLLKLFSEDFKAFEDAEKSRMGSVMKNFTWIKRIELGLFLVGVLLLLLAMNGTISTIMLGVGIGLLIQCALMLVFDLFAELRAREYLREMDRVQRKL